MTLWTYSTITPGTLTRAVQPNELAAKLNEYCDAVNLPGYKISTDYTGKLHWRIWQDFYHSVGDLATQLDWWDSGTSTFVKKTRSQIFDAAMGGSYAPPRGLVTGQLLEDMRTILNYIAANAWQSTGNLGSLQSSRYRSAAAGYSPLTADPSWSACRDAARAAVEYRQQDTGLEYYWDSASFPRLSYQIGAIKSSPGWDCDEVYSQEYGVIAYRPMGTSTLDLSGLPSEMKNSNALYKALFRGLSNESTGFLHLYRGCLAVDVTIGSGSGTIGSPGAFVSQYTFDLSYSDLDFTGSGTSYSIDDSSQSPLYTPPDLIADISAWSSATTYDPGDSVSHSVGGTAAYYTAKQTHSNVEPGVDANWEDYWFECGAAEWGDGESGGSYYTTTYEWSSPEPDTIMVRPWIAWAHA